MKIWILVETEGGEHTEIINVFTDHEMAKKWYYLFNNGDHVCNYALVEKDTEEDIEDGDD